MLGTRQTALSGVALTHALRVVRARACRATWSALSLRTRPGPTGRNRGRAGVAGLGSAANRDISRLRTLL